MIFLVFDHFVFLPDHFLSTFSGLKSSSVSQRPCLLLRMLSRPGNTVLVRSSAAVSAGFHTNFQLRHMIVFLCGLNLQPPSCRRDGRATARSQNTRNSGLQVRKKAFLICHFPSVLLRISFFLISELFLVAIAVQAWWKGILARRRAQRRREAANTIRR